MAFIPALNTVRISFEFSLAGEIVVNVIYAEKSTTILSTDLTSLITALRGWWTSDGKTHRAPALALTAIRTRNLTFAAGEVEDYIYPTPEAGTYAGEVEASQVAAVVSFRTGLAGRSHRGRNYLAGINSGAVTGNVIATADAAGYVADYVALADAIETVTGFKHVVCSFYTAKFPRATALTTPITQYICNTRVDTQRRRLPKL